MTYLNKIFSYSILQVNKKGYLHVTTQGDMGFFVGCDVAMDAGG